MKRENIFKNRVLPTFFFNCAATVIVVGMDALFNDVSRALRPSTIFESFVYSNCIGTFLSAAIYASISRWHKTSPAAKYLQLTATIFAATYGGIVAANLILAMIGLGTFENAFGTNWRSFAFALLIALTLGFSGYFYKFTQSSLEAARERLRQRELDLARAETLASEAQLAALESRLHPHFLFNTLNSIAALIREDAGLAEKTVEQLARLLRYSLEANVNRLVPLEQELRITLDYLEIERVRFGERLQYLIDVDKNLLTAEVPPFALQTLVENSIKHVAAKRPGAIEILISAVPKNDFLEIAVRDDGDGFSIQNIKAGHGLDNLQKRLLKIFDEQVVLEIRKNNGHSYIAFRVPTRKILSRR